MKHKFYIHLSIMILLCFCMAQSAQAITEFGKNSFYKPGVSTEGEMKNLLLSEQDDVRTGMTKAGQGPLVDTFLAQLPDAEVRMVDYPTGHTFQWMFYRKNGTGPVRVDKELVWEGNEPVSAYEFHVDDEGLRYTFAVVPVCANLSLIDISPTPPPPPEPVATVAPPVAAEPVKPEPVTPVEEQVPAKRMMFVADAGYLHQLDPANYFFVRGGLEYKLTDNFSILGMIGVSPKLDGTDGTSAFIADALVNYSWSRFFIGAGIGAWITDGDDDLDSEDSDLDLILNVGSRIYGEPDAFNISAFVEARSAVDELDDFDLYGRLGAGLRFRF